MNQSILKIDRQGRFRYTQEQKKAIVDAYLASGLSVSRFATLHGVNYQTLVSWLKKVKTQGRAVPPRSLHSALLSLVPAEIERTGGSSTEGAMEVLLPNGTKILITSPSQLDLAVVLIRELNNSRPC